MRDHGGLVVMCRIRDWKDMGSVHVIKICRVWALVHVNMSWIKRLLNGMVGLERLTSVDVSSSSFNRDSKLRWYLYHGRQNRLEKNQTSILRTLDSHLHMKRSRAPSSCIVHETGIMLPSIRWGQETTPLNEYNRTQNLCS